LKPNDLRDHTPPAYFDVKPEPGKMYLKPLHGRDYPDQQLNDWGFDGPWIGPLEAVHDTYRTDTAFYFLDAPEGAEEAGPANFFVGDLLLVDGKYYGDYEIQIYRS
jgi:hypothetical protein